ncbi:unnamed protein product, partial [Tetraodon nigroviridis]
GSPTRSPTAWVQQQKTTKTWEVPMAVAAPKPQLRERAARERPLWTAVKSSSSNFNPSS